METKLQFNAVYAATFDPPTKGHAWMIYESLRLFKRLMIVVASNPGKTPLYEYVERAAFLFSMARDVKTELVNREEGQDEDFEFAITSLTDQLVVDYANEVGAKHLIRGIRSVSDFDYERQMQLVNLDRSERVTTVFLMPPRNLAEISSSLVKGLVPYVGDWGFLGRYVTPEVAQSLFLKHQIKKAKTAGQHLEADAIGAAHGLHLSSLMRVSNLLEETKK